MQEFVKTQCCFIPSYGKIGIIIVTHKAYFSYLNDCLLSVVNQKRNLHRKILVVNDPSGTIPTTISNDLLSQFTILHCNTSFSEARRIGLNHLINDVDWVIFLDGDNALDNNYLESVNQTLLDNSDHRIGIVSCNLVDFDASVYLRNTDNTNIDFLSYFLNCNLVDSGSVWSTQALFNMPKIDNYFSDYIMALSLFYDGYSIIHGSQRLRYRLHSEQLSEKIKNSLIGEYYDLYKNYYRLGIVQLLSNKSYIVDELIENVKIVDLPKNTFWVIINTSPSNSKVRQYIKFIKETFEFCLIKDENIPNSDQLINLPRSLDQKVLQDIHELNVIKHRTVNYLYNKAISLLPRVSHVLTWEDDVVGVKPDSVFNLFLMFQQLQPRCPDNIIAAISYPIVYSNKEIPVQLLDCFSENKLNFKNYLHLIQKDIPYIFIDKTTYQFTLWNYLFLKDKVIPGKVYSGYSDNENKAPALFSFDFYWTTRQAQKHNNKIVLNLQQFLQHKPPN